MHIDAARVDNPSACEGSILVVSWKSVDVWICTLAIPRVLMAGKKVAIQALSLSTSPSSLQISQMLVTLHHGHGADTLEASKMSQSVR